MTPDEQIRILLDPYFERLRAKGENMQPAKPPGSRQDAGAPAEMVEGPTRYEGIVFWKVLPSTLGDKHIDKLEKQARGPFPPLFRAYLKYGHFFCDEITMMLPATPSDNPLGDLRMYMEGSREIVDAGYVAFGAGRDGIGIVCFDYGARLPDGDCPIVIIDADDIVNLDDEDRRRREKVQPLAEPFAPSFAALAQRVFGA